MPTPETADPLAALAPGAKLDRYEIVRRVASGGMGSVYLARFSGKHGFEKQVAIKTILPSLAENDQFRKMFLDEARISSRLEHANVAQILDLGEHAGMLYIAFEWVDGSSLEQLCREEEELGAPLALGIALKVMADVCAGLHAAHELVDADGRPLRVVHRDVTPNNVLVSAKGFAKVIDFGVAKARHRLAGETKSGIVKGTPQYMSPEQARGEQVDRRADVWSCGAVLYRVVAGAPPFADRGELAAFVRKRAELRSLPSTVPAEVKDIVLRAMARDPAARFATADEMRTAIERAKVTLADRAPVLRRAAGAEGHVVTVSGQPTAIEELALARTSTALPVTPDARDRPTEPRNRRETTGSTTPERRAPRDDARTLKIALVAALAIAAIAVGVTLWVLLTT